VHVGAETPITPSKRPSALVLRMLKLKIWSLLIFPT